MGTKTIPDGIYTVMGPGGQLGMPAPGSLLLLPPEDAPPQRWDVKSGSGGYTLRDVATGSYLGGDGDPNDVVMMLNGTGKPFTWQLSDGPDHDPNTYVLTSAASSEGLVLAPSLLRIYPPRVAIMPSRGDYNVEWTFAKVGLPVPGPIGPDDPATALHPHLRPPALARACRERRAPGSGAGCRCPQHRRLRVG